jgi:hypothetical protein
LTENGNRRGKLWNAVKAVLRGRFVASHAYILKERRLKSFI